MEKYKNPAVVLGVSNCGIGITRSLVEAGIDIIAVDFNRRATGMYSRYGKKFLSPNPAKEEEKTLEFMLKLGKELGKESKAVLFPSDDSWTLFVSKFGRQLKDYFLFDYLAPKKINEILKKDSFYRNAAKAGVKIPETFFPADERIERIANKINYPCIIKPVDTVDFSEKFGVKLFDAGNKKQLVERYKKAKAKHCECIVQERILCEQAAWYTYGSYIDGKGHALAEFTGRKIRQHPPFYGTCSAGESIYDGKLFAPGLKILRQYKYSGISEVEFIRSRDGEYFMIEVNPRTWLWNRTATKSGVNVPLVAYLSLIGKEVVPINTFKNNAKWVDLQHDLQTYSKLRKMGLISLGEWLKSISGNVEFLGLTLDDPLIYPKKIISRVFGG